MSPGDDERTVQAATRRLRDDAVDVLEKGLVRMRWIVVGVAAMVGGIAQQDRSLDHVEPLRLARIEIAGKV
jgi:hypothetical protein